MVNQLKQDLILEVEKAMIKMNNGYQINLDYLVDKIFYIKSLK